MANFTLIELHIDEGSFSTSLPFSNLKTGTDEDDEAPTGDSPAEDEEDATEAAGSTSGESGGPGKGKAAFGILLFLIVAAALVRYLSGEDEETDVDIHTAEDDGPVGVTVDTDSE